MKILKSCRKDKEIEEKLKERIERFTEKPHIMVCHNCGSKLEVKENEFEIHEDGFYSFNCPVCNYWNLVFSIEKWFGRLRKIIVDLIKRNK